MRIVLLPTALVTLAAIAVYLWTFIMAGRARGKYNVKAPAITGPEPFERAIRVQTNTLEQIVPFLPALWICAAFYPMPAAIIGAVWVVGRIIYGIAYYADPAKRGFGFTVAIAATVLLWVGGVLGIVMAWLA
ncbi:MAPEG family protein [Desertibaculum subflavum]|uniref:MAPEG family protein n=1 Tax=Desertibaculum subflavum TaxID=2268458 RepID=UPI000E6601F4